MNCNAPVYTPAAITVPATERKSAHISSLSLLGAASASSLISLTVCFLLLLLRVGPVCFPFLCSLFSSSGLGSVLLACSATHLSSLLSLVPYTFLQLLCLSLLLSGPSCVPWFHDRDYPLQLLGFFPAIFTTQ